MKVSPKHIELTTSGLSAEVAPHGAQPMSLKTIKGRSVDNVLVASDQGEGLTLCYESPG